MLLVSAEGTRVVRGFSSAGGGDALPEPAAEGRRVPCLEALTGWCARYRRITATRSGATLRELDAEIAALGEIGAEIYAWLDQGGALAAWVAGGERVLEVRADPADPSPMAEALLAVPWEALCRKGVFLAEEVQPFVVVRRCAGRGAPAELPHADLSLMFMAAAPEGARGLDYEREEAAILGATRARDGRAPLAHVHVEESGALAFLADRLRLDGPFEALHLSCHGDIREGANGAPVSVLLLETAEGAGDPVDPDRLIREIAGGMPPLVFLSACRTAERRGGAGLPPGRGDRAPGLEEAMPRWEPELLRDAGGAEVAAAPDLADPYARRLAAQVPNVLGWDGSVYDTDATLFAEALYGALSRGDTVPVAAARARQALFRSRAEGPGR